MRRVGTMQRAPTAEPHAPLSRLRLPAKRLPGERGAADDGHDEPVTVREVRELVGEHRLDLRRRERVYEPFGEHHDARPTGSGNGERVR